MTTLNEVIHARKLLRLKRRNIINDDFAVSVFYKTDFGLPVTEESFLAHKYASLVGVPTQFAPNPTVSDINCYCQNVGSTGAVINDSKIPNMIVGYGLQPDRYPTSSGMKDVSQDLIDITGKDAFQIGGEFFADKDMEYIYTYRISDRHDTDETPEQLIPMKKQLYDAGALLSNNGVDFTHPLARELSIAPILEAINNDKYIFDGVCLDFTRHFGLFPNSVASTVENATLETTQAQLDIVTAWVHEVNDAINARNIIRMDRGEKPLILMIKTTDNAQHNKMCGLDVERWMREGVVDVLIPIFYNQFEFLQDTVTWGKRFGVAVAPCMIDPRISSLNGRASNAGAVGRIAQMVSISPDGMEFYNWNYVLDNDTANGDFKGPKGSMWRHLDYDRLVAKFPSRYYFVTWAQQESPLFIGSEASLPARKFFESTINHLSSNHQWLTEYGEGRFVLEVYEKQESFSTVKICIYCSGISGGSCDFNGTRLVLSAEAYGYSATVPNAKLKYGLNSVVLKAVAGKFTDIRLEVNS